MTVFVELQVEVDAVFGGRAAAFELHAGDGDAEKIGFHEIHPLVVASLGVGAPRRLARSSWRNLKDEA